MTTRARRIERWRRRGLVLALALLAGCGDSGSTADQQAGERPAAVRPHGSERLKKLPDKALAAVPEDGPYRFFDRERRPAARDLAWLLLKASRLPSVPREKVGVDLVGSLKGVSLGHFKLFFESLGLRPHAVEESLEAFARRHTPGLLAMKPVNPHLPEWACSFLLLRGVTPDGKLAVTDPLTGAHEVEEAALAERYLGAALYLEQDRVGPLINEPDIGVDEIVYSYGRVDAGTLVRKTFRIFNRGEKPLKIFGIRPTCGCLATPLHEKRDARVADPRATFKRNPDTGVWEIDFAKNKLSTVIAPRGEVYVTGFYDTTNRIGRQPTSFTVVSGDPDERELTFLVEGFVTQVAQFDPPVLHWPEIRSAEGARAHVWIRNMKGKPFTISRIEVKNEHLAVVPDPAASREPQPAASLPPGSAPRAHPASEGWQALEVRVKSGAAVGPFNAVIQLWTDFTASPLAFGAWGEVKGNVVVEPSLASFGRVRLGVQSSARIRIYSKRPGPFQVTDAVVNRPKLMDVALEEEKPGVYRIELTLKKGWQAPSLNGQLAFRTSDPLEPLKYVEVTGFVRR